jgi:hypothetical protein
MRLFGDFERTIMGPAERNQDSYDYMNDSVRPEVQEIRTRLENWFKHYPDREKAEFVKRFQSQEQFDSSSFELAMHELLLRLDYTVTVHPDNVSATNAKPDFLAIDSELNSLIIECAFSSGKSRQEKGMEKLREDLFQALEERLHSPDYWIGISPKGYSKSAIKVNSILHGLQAFIDSQDYENVQRLAQNDRYWEIPTWIFEQKGLKVEFTLLPKDPHSRGVKGIRSFGIRSESFIRPMEDFIAPLRKLLKHKSNLYGRISYPFVVVMNQPRFVGHNEIIQALFGTEKWIVHAEKGKFLRQSDIERRMVRDGVWTSNPTGPNYTRLSGVLVVKGLVPWSESEATAQLYLNPWAAFPLGEHLAQLPRVILKDGKLEHIEGESLVNLLSLTGKTNSYETRP